MRLYVIKCLHPHQILLKRSGNKRLFYIHKEIFENVRKSEIEEEKYSL